MTNEVVDLLIALRDSSMSLSEVADRFRDRSWPRRDDPEPTTYLELAARARKILIPTFLVRLMTSLLPSTGAN